MSTPIRSVDIPSGETDQLTGSVVPRGIIGRAATLNILGDVKIGKFLEIGDMATISCHAEDRSTGGTIIVAERAHMPSTITLAAERKILLEDSSLPSQSIFDSLRIYAPVIDISHLPPLETTRLMLAPSEDAINSSNHTPTEFPGTRLDAGVLYSKQITLGIFELITARSIKNFMHTSGSPITAKNIDVTSMQECTVRAQQVRIKQGEGLLIFFPYTAALSDPPTFGSMFAPDSENYQILINDIRNADNPYLNAILQMLLSPAYASAQGADNTVATINDEMFLDQQFALELAEYFPNGKDSTMQQVYAGLIAMGMFAQRGISSTTVEIEELHAAPSSVCIKGHNHTKVFLQNGGLTIKRLTDHGAVINAPSGNVTIVECVFSPDATLGELFPTEIHAAEIHFSARAAASPTFSDLKLFGHVFIEGIRKES